MNSANDKQDELLLSLRDVAITYDQGATPIVTGIDLQLRKGECMLVLGPSGCGKSTVALACADLLPEPVEGQVSGEVWRAPELMRPGATGYVFQDADAQFCMLTTGDEIAFGLENRSIARAEMPDRIALALHEVGLAVTPQANHALFSGGMKQKLALASALALEPQLLILDEPTANLDPLATAQVFAEVARLHERGQTLLIIEHKFDRLLPHVDTVVLLDGSGHLYRAGPAREVIAKEWQWLVQTGVVAPWKSLPALLAGRPTAWANVQEASSEEVALVRTEGQGAAPVAKVDFSLRAAGVSYGQKRVWQGVDLTIARGSFTVIVGPNGAGKSTLLQVLAGLQTVTTGEVELLGRASGNWRRRELSHALAYCFQNPEFQFIYERVVEELANRSLPEGTIPDDVAALLQEFGLTDHVWQSPFALSQGQKRRLSVAAMLREAHNAYLLDEPTFGQDARTQQVIMDQLTALHQAGKTIVITTHDMDLVRRYATQVIVVAEGGVLFAGAVHDLFEQPELVQRAHLLADTDDGSAQKFVPGEQQVMPVSPPVRRRQTPAHALNPPVQMTATLIALMIAMYADNLQQALALFALPLFLMMALCWLTPWQIIKRMSPFLLFYMLYIWSLTAYSQVTVDTPTIHVLWWRLSLVGLNNGLVLAFRMLSGVGFGVLFASSAEITDLVVGLCKNFRLQPRFAYGILAGIRVVPLFQSEWKKLKQARQLRGKDARYQVFQPVTYALPLLTQAIRLSERMAIAMEARGFRGQAALSYRGRTFYRNVRIRSWDLLYGIAIVAASAAIVLAFSASG